MTIFCYESESGDTIVFVNLEAVTHVVAGPGACHVRFAGPEAGLRITDPGAISRLVTTLGGHIPADGRDEEGGGR